MKIDTSEWGEFRIGDLFEIISPNAVNATNIVQSDNGIPYVVRSKFNSGIKTKIMPIKDSVLSPAGVITFGTENSTFFYQKEPFYSGQNIHYIDTREISRLACQFLITCLQKLSSKYSYNFGMKPSLLSNEVLQLPVDSSGNPDWVYMESYMNSVLQESEASLQKMEKMGEKRKVETSGWGRFRIGELFSCELAKGDIQAPTAKEGKYPLVSAGNPESSGIVKYISERDDSEMFPSGTITVDMFGFACYQTKEFYSVSHGRVNVLIPSKNIVLNELSGKFISTCINKALNGKFGYNRLCNSKNVLIEEIMLPVRKSNTIHRDPLDHIDFQYMESYMQRIMSESEKKISSLQA